MNMQSLMAQAQKLQKEITQKKEELNNKEFTEKNDLVELVFTGDKKLKKIKISENVDLSDLEVLEDMIMVASKKIYEQIDNETEKIMGPYGNSLNGIL